MTSVYLLIVGVAVIVAPDHSDTHIHTLRRTPLEEGSVRGRDLYLGRFHPFLQATKVLMVSRGIALLFLGPRH